MLAVSDNGANVAKAVKLLQERETASQAEEQQKAQLSVSDMTAGQGDEETNNDMEMGEFSNENESDDSRDELELPDNVPFRRMACMAHTPQLVIKQVYKSEYADKKVIGGY